MSKRTKRQAKRASDSVDLLEFDDESHNSAQIVVIGVGGGGGNALNNMIDCGLSGGPWRPAPGSGR